MAHLHPPTLVPAVVTELAIAASNQSMDSWDQSPSATEVELHLMKWLAQLVGFSDDGSGVMTSGGTASNLLGLTLARSWAAQRIGVDVLKTGLPAQASKLANSLFGSGSLLRAARRSPTRTRSRSGTGRRERTERRMSIGALDETLEEPRERGLSPIALVGTAGTTDLGVIDPLKEIGERAAT